MTMSPVGLTAQWIAAARALETDAESPLFVDPFARDLAGDAGFAMLADMRGATGAGVSGPDPYLSIRTRYLDDELAAAVREHALTQVVLLAAGMDTRAFRLDWPAGVTLFEVDRDDVFDYKEPILQQSQAAATCDRRVVRADLTGDWAPALSAAGFDPAVPTAFLVEGLTMYLHEADVDRLFTSLKALAAPGSWLGGDVVNKEMIESSFTAGYMKKLEDLGCGWYFGTSHPESFFAQYGWKATTMMPGETRAKFKDRWNFPVIPRSVPNIPRTYYITATRLGETSTLADLGVILKRFDQPDEVREMEKGRFEIVRLGTMTIGRATYEPGWKWSEHVGRALGETRCSVEHLGMVLSGTATAAFADGRIVELRAGEMFYIPPVAHDSWVVGDEPYVSIHFLGAERYAK